MEEPTTAPKEVEPKMDEDNVQLVASDPNDAADAAADASTEATTETDGTAAGPHKQRRVSIVCGTFGCTLANGHRGLCMAAEAGERSARRRAKPTWMLTQEAESALDAEVESALESRMGAVVGSAHARGGRTSTLPGHTAISASLGAPGAGAAPGTSSTALFPSGLGFGCAARLLPAHAPAELVAECEAKAKERQNAPWGLGYAASICVLDSCSKRRAPPPAPLCAAEQRLSSAARSSGSAAKATGGGFGRRPAVAPSDEAEGVTDASAVGSIAQWCAPEVGATVYVEVAAEEGKVVWQPAQVRAHRHLNGAVVSFTACINKDEQFIERFSYRQEGKEWRRAMPCKFEHVEVEVEEDGKTEWRTAIVQKRFLATGEFTAAVCLPDGTPDHEFVETFQLSREGREWRRLC